MNSPGLYRPTKTHLDAPSQARKWHIAVDRFGRIEPQCGQIKSWRLDPETGRRLEPRQWELLSTDTPRVVFDALRDDLRCNKCRWYG